MVVRLVLRRPWQFPLAGVARGMTHSVLSLNQEASHGFMGLRIPSGKPVRRPSRAAFKSPSALGRKRIKLEGIGARMGVGSRGSRAFSVSENIL